MSARAPVFPGTHLFRLDDEGVLFCEATQELHLLNATATLIFRLIEEGYDEAGAGAEVARLGGIAPARAARFVAAAMAQLRDVRSGSPRQPAAADTVDVPWRASRPAETRRYRFLGSTFEVRYPTAAHKACVHPVLAHLACADRGAADVVVDCVTTPDREVIYRDRKSFGASATAAGVAPIVKSLVWTTAVNRCSFFLDIHAGVVGGAAGCVLLPGSPGSGKSTLTALLAREGYEFLSDEIALLTQDTLSVIPAPLAICVKESGIGPLAGAYPQLPQLPLHLRGDGKRVAYLPPPPQSLSTDAAPRPVAALVFPEYSPRRPARLAAVPKAAALKRLLDECVVVRALDAVKVAALVRWIVRTPCYHLRFGSATQAVGKIRAVVPPKHPGPSVALTLTKDACPKS
ncbi:MAG: hypothetical protein IT518_28485 [Burkholderiales bacterium]|nr:hypothetical protein [Burkholderiales bacterium]